MVYYFLFITLKKHFKPCFFILKALKDILQHFKFVNWWIGEFLVSFFWCHDQVIYKDCLSIGCGNEFWILYLHFFSWNEIQNSLSNPVNRLFFKLRPLKPPTAASEYIQYLSKLFTRSANELRILFWWIF